MVQNAYKVTLVSAFAPLVLGSSGSAPTYRRRTCSRSSSGSPRGPLPEALAPDALVPPQLVGMALLVPRHGARLACTGVKRRSRMRRTPASTDPGIGRASPLARILLLVYVLLVAYASLYPFEGWRAVGLSPFAYLSAPWPRYVTAFDVVVNVAGYVPYGFLAVAALRPTRARRRRIRSRCGQRRVALARARGGADLPAGALRQQPRRAVQPRRRRARAPPSV